MPDLSASQGTTMTRREARAMASSARKSAHPHRRDRDLSRAEYAALMVHDNGNHASHSTRRTRMLKVTAPSGNGAGRSGWAYPVGRPTPTMLDSRWTDRRWDK